MSDDTEEVNVTELLRQSQPKLVAPRLYCVRARLDSATDPSVSTRAHDPGPVFLHRDHISGAHLVMRGCARCGVVYWDLN